VSDDERATLRPTAGRRRDPEIDAAVIAATLQVLGEVGYAKLSIGAVAHRAHVYRPAIYRRWPTKQHLVTDAIASTIGVTPTPGTGDLRADLIAGVATIAAGFADPALGHVLLPVIADLPADPGLRTQFLQRVFRPRRDTTRATLEHAIERSLVKPTIDMEFVLDALAAPIYFRALFQHAALDQKLIDDTVDLVLAGISTAAAAARAAVPD
jgi:AcrR family transcriptional regulator